MQTGIRHQIRTRTSLRFYENESGVRRAQMYGMFQEFAEYVVHQRLYTDYLHEANITVIEKGETDE